MKMYIVIEQNGKESRFELSAKDVKKHQYGFEVPKPKTGKLYDSPIRIGEYEVRTNSCIFFVNDINVIDENNDQPLTRAKAEKMTLPELRREFSLAPKKGQTKEFILNRYFGTEKPAAKTEKVEFTAQDAPQVSGNDALIALSNALSEGKISIETYLMQLQLLQRNGIIK